MSNTSEAKKIGRPPGADADRTRTAILDAALEAFAERGFDGASIREITGAAGVGHNLVRHYFGTKADLWRATVHHGLGPAADQIRTLLEASDGDTLDQTIRDILQTLVDEVEGNPVAVRLLVAEALRGGPRFDEIFDDVLAPLSEVLVRALGHPDGGLADVDVRVLSLFVFGAVFGSLSAEGMVDRLGLQRGRRVRSSGAVTDGLLGLVMHGLRGPG